MQCFNFHTRYATHMYKHNAPDLRYPPPPVATDKERQLLPQQPTQAPICLRSPAVFPYYRVAPLSSPSHTLRSVLYVWRLVRFFQRPTASRILTLNNSVYRTAFLTKPAIDALRHINVISRRSPTPVLSFLCLNCNRTRWADRLTQFTRNAPLLPGWISP